MLQNKMLLVPTSSKLFQFRNHYKSNSHVGYLNDFGLLSTAHPIPVFIQLAQTNNLALHCKTLSHAQA